jgi:hypothetical protein
MLVNLWPMVDTISYVLWPVGIYCGHYGEFSRFGKLYQEKSDNPAYDMSSCESGTSYVITTNTGSYNC